MGYNTETAYCAGCKTLQSIEWIKYYYSIKCTCCDGGIHFERLPYCNLCSSKPPTSIKVFTQPFKQV